MINLPLIAPRCVHGVFWKTCEKCLTPKKNSSTKSEA